MAVKFIIDAGCDLTEQQANALGVTLIPMTIRFGSKEYRSGIDLSHEEFYEMLAKENELPTTSQPAPYEFEAVYQRIKNDGVLTGALKSLFAVAESYPDLKANANFAALQRELSDIEDEIAASRKYYNGVIKTYNTKVEMFTGNIVASIFGFKRKPLYEVSDAAERENVKAQF